MCYVFYYPIRSKEGIRTPISPAAPAGAKYHLLPCYIKVTSCKSQVASYTIVFTHYLRLTACDYCFTHSPAYSSAHHLTQPGGRLRHREMPVSERGHTA